MPSSAVEALPSGNAGEEAETAELDRPCSRSACRLTAHFVPWNLAVKLDVAEFRGPHLSGIHCDIHTYHKRNSLLLVSLGTVQTWASSRSTGAYLADAAVAGAPLTVLVTVMGSNHGHTLAL